MDGNSPEIRNGYPLHIARPIRYATHIWKNLYQSSVTKTVLTTSLCTPLSIFEQKYFSMVLQFVVKNCANYLTSEFNVNANGLVSASLSINGLFRNRILLPRSINLNTVQFYRSPFEPPFRSTKHEEAHFRLKHNT
jgi:hypothetical protein